MDLMFFLISLDRDVRDMFLLVRWGVRMGFFCQRGALVCCWIGFGSDLVGAARRGNLEIHITSFYLQSSAKGRYTVSMKR